MKILITSDIHGNIKNLKYLKSKYYGYHHLDAGDSVIDNNLLSSLNITSVRGNCDFNYQLPLYKIVEYGDLKILISHGHLYNVKNSLEEIIKWAIKEHANILIYGHTHQPLLEQYQNLTILNPGSLNEGSYAVYQNNKIILKKV